MNNFRLSLLMFLLVAGNSWSFTDEELKDVATGLSDNLMEEGHQVSEGVYLHLQYKYCHALVDTVGRCNSINKWGSYGVALLPTIDGELPPTIDFAEAYTKVFEDLGQEPPDWVDDGLTPYWRLDRTEAIVVIGNTPPNVPYFSYQIYWAEKPSSGFLSENGLQPVMAETDLPINNDIIRERLDSEDEFGEGIVIITTANYALYVELRTLLIYNYEVEPKRIFLQKIPTADIDLPMSIEGSSFVYQNRVISSPEADNADDVEAYLDGPPVRVLRVTPDPAEQAQYEPIPMWEIPNRKTGTNEDNLRLALRALIWAVNSAYMGNDQVVKAVRFFNSPIVGPDCLVGQFPFCSGMVTDAAYGGVLNPRKPAFGPSPNDFDVVVGVNHVKTGKARLQSVQFTNSHQVAVAAFTVDETMKGESVEHYLPYVIRTLRPLVEMYKDQLYAIKVSHHCEDSDPFCVKLEYPSEEIIGLEDGENYGVIERTYREPTATYGPDPSEILPPRLISVRERGTEK